MGTIDENADKKLTWKEVVSARTKLQDLSALQKVYMQMDIDGDGFVDSKEWGKNHDDKISWDEIRSTVFDVHDQHDLKEELAELEQADNVNEESKQRMADLLATIKKKKPE